MGRKHSAAGTCGQCEAPFAVAATHTIAASALSGPREIDLRPLLLGSITRRLPGLPCTCSLGGGRRPARKRASSDPTIQERASGRSRDISKSRRGSGGLKRRAKALPISLAKEGALLPRLALAAGGHRHQLTDQEGLGRSQHSGCILLMSDGTPQYPLANAGIPNTRREKRSNERDPKEG